MQHKHKLGKSFWFWLKKLGLENEKASIHTKCVCKPFTQRAAHTSVCARTSRPCIRGFGFGCRYLSLAAVSHPVKSRKDRHPASSASNEWGRNSRLGTKSDETRRASMWVHTQIHTPTGEQLLNIHLYGVSCNEQKLRCRSLSTVRRYAQDTTRRNTFLPTVYYRGVIAHERV